jgi:DUF438 domain-containing protein
MTDGSVRLDYLLDSLKDPFVYCDTDHVIRYMNQAARLRYEGRPAEVGRSIFDCHNEASNALIREVCARFEAGEDEVLMTDNEKHRIYMRCVRDDAGTFIGYYERYEPPIAGRP